MSDGDLIEVRGVSKRFRIYNKPFDIIKEFVCRRPYGDDFWALRDISLGIPARQRLGIVGPNGSGKSTLLRIITGSLQPTLGEVHVRGKLSAVLSKLHNFQTLGGPITFTKLGHSVTGRTYRVIEVNNNVAKVVGEHTTKVIPNIH